MHETGYKTLDPVEFNVSDLLLWPENPRLKFGDFADRNYSPSQLQDPKIQAKLLHRLQEPEETGQFKLLIKEFQES